MEQLATVTIFYRSSEKTSLVRREKLSIVDLISNFGGQMGARLFCAMR